MREYRGGILALCVCMLALTACRHTDTAVCVNSSELAVRCGEVYAFRLDEPLIYSCKNGNIGKLVSDPFVRLDRSEMQNQYAISPGPDNQLYAALKIANYTLYEIDPLTLESRVDCQIDDGSGSSSFLGLNDLLDIHIATGSVPTRSRMYGFVPYRDEQIIIRDSGLYSLKRGRSGYETCLYEAEIKETNTAFDGENLYFIDQDNALQRFSLKERKGQVIREDVYSFYLLESGLLFTPYPTEKGLYRMDTAGQNVEHIADIPCDAFLVIGDTIVVIRTDDKCVYAVKADGAEPKKIVDKAVSKIAAFSPDGTTSGLCYLADGKIEYITSDGKTGYIQAP